MLTAVHHMTSSVIKTFLHSYFISYLCTRNFINPIWAGLWNDVVDWGGHFLPGSPKIVCRVHVDCATLTKFLDFVFFNVRHVPEKSPQIFFSERCQKYSKGGPF